MQLALTGIPLTGVKTVFSAISGHAEPAGVHSWAPGQSRLIVVKIPDERLDFISKAFKPKKTTLATVTLAEFPGLFGGPGTDSGLIGRIREADALVIVLRTFESEANPHPAGSVDPARDLDRIYSDFVIADMGVLESRVDRLEKNLKRARNEDDAAELEVLVKCRAALDAGRGVRDCELKEDERKRIRSYCFLTEKPLILVLNVGEDQLGQEEELMAPFKARGYEVQAICGSLEAELSQLGPDERLEFMKDFGLKQLAAPKVLGAAYRTLDIVTFFTFAGDECRAWQIHRGETAVAAAGKVHTDLARGFIRAEVIAFEDFKVHGGMKEVKAAGKLRLEGRDYVVREGEMLLIRHNA
jgi:GTP-binding protein YchF